MMDGRRFAGLALTMFLLAAPTASDAESDYAGMLLNNQSLLADPPKSCDHDKEPLNTFQLEQCAAVAFKQADADMNTAYQAAFRNGSEARGKALQAAQRLWLSLRNQECAWEASKYEGGTLEPVAMGNCLVDITRARTSTLKDDLSP